MLREFYAFNSRLLSVLDAHCQLEHLVQASGYAHNLVTGDGLDQIGNTLVLLCEEEMERVLANMDQDLQQLRAMLSEAKEETPQSPLPPPVNGSIT